MFLKRANENTRNTRRMTRDASKLSTLWLAAAVACCSTSPAAAFRAESPALNAARGPSCERPPGQCPLRIVPNVTEVPTPCMSSEKEVGEMSTDKPETDTSGHGRGASAVVPKL